jgi:glycosyltransferase involved in cell wall biosynthesis
MKVSATNHNALRVSIVIPTHNRATLVKRAVDSVIAQCIEGDEVIVVDDGSTDGTEAALQPVRDQILYVRVPHGGAGKARNAGLLRARNPLIGFLDSDDEWMPHKLQLQRALLQRRPKILFCFSDLAYRFTSGEELHGIMTQEYTEPRIWDLLDASVAYSSIAPLPEGHPDFRVHVGDLYPSQMARGFVQVNTLLYRRSDIAVSFPEDLRTREDWEFVGRLSKQGLAAYMDCETSWIYKHEGSQLMNLPYVIYLEDRLKLLERVWGCNDAFVRTHSKTYSEVHDDLYWRLMREWLCTGRTKDAREELARHGEIPWQFHLLTRQPALVNRVAFRLRDMVCSD